MTPALPQELIGAIIHFLHDDQISLRNCSITAKSWSYWSRAHLFNEICLDPLPPNAQNKLTCLQACLVRSPFLTRQIRCVELRNFLGDAISLGIAASLSRILESLTDVSELRLQESSSIFSDSIRDTVCRLMKRDSLKYITIRNAFLNPSYFIQLLSLPQNLVGLTLYDIRLYRTPLDNESVSFPRNPPRRNIKKLHIRGHIDPSLVEWTTGSDSFLNLNALSRLQLSPLCYSGLCLPLVRAFASVLQHLEVHVYDQPSFDIFISQMPRLLSVKLFGALPCMSLMFQGLEGNHPLEDVEIVQYSDALTSSDDDFSALDDLLTCPALGSLRAVQMTVVPLRAHKYDEERVMDLLPRLRERGILIVARNLAKPTGEEYYFRVFGFNDL